MALPKINAPVFTTKLPSSGQSVNYRPFTVKEEKILLMAASSEDASQIITAIGQIVGNCTMDVDVAELATFDVEYLFLQIRGKSVGNIIKVTLNDQDESEKADVDLDAVEVIFPKNISNQIKLDDNIILVMKYPKYKNIESLDANENAAPGASIFKTAVDKLVVNDEVFSFEEYTLQEIEEFVDSFTSKNMKDVQDFFANMPYVKGKAVTESGREVDIIGLTSFFT